MRALDGTFGKAPCFEVMLGREDPVALVRRLLRSFIFASFRRLDCCDFAFKFNSSRVEWARGDMSVSKLSESRSGCLSSKLDIWGLRAEIIYECTFCKLFSRWRRRSLFFNMSCWN